MAKVTKPQPQACSIPAQVESELFELRNIIGLCAFAAEARRVLQRLDDVTSLDTALYTRLNGLIHARQNWSDFGDRTGDVLNDVQRRLNVLLNDEQ